MPTVLIAGANRGIGLEFARQYAADGWHVIGTARAPDEAAELRGVATTVHALDIADPASITALASAVDEPVDLLLSVSGVYGPRQFSDDPAGFVDTLATNAVGPTLLAHALKERVVAAGGRMVAITSQMGSIADNGSGGSVAYRASKAALNAAWRSLSIDWKPDGVTLAMLHPGWVRTDMGGENAAISPAESVTAMRATIAGLTIEETGCFLTKEGNTIPW